MINRRDFLRWAGGAAGALALPAGAVMPVPATLQRAPWVPAAFVRGAAITAVQMEPGLMGSKNTALNANRIYLAAATGGDNTGGSLWCGFIKGTAATLLANSSSSAGAIVVSVDGGAYANAADSSFTYTLFTGLPDVEHYVVIKIGAAFGQDNVYLNKLGSPTILNITGSNPYLRMATDWVHTGVTNALSVASGMTVANVANYTPNRSKRGVYTGVSNIGSARIRGDFRTIFVASNGPAGLSSVYISKDGGTPVKHTLPLTPGTGGYIHAIKGLSGLHTYNVWTNVSGIIFGAAGDSPHVDIGAKRQMHQFGDSTTNGSTGGNEGESEVLRTAAALGFAGTTIGVHGQAIDGPTGLDVALDTYLPALTVTSDDVAVLAVGRNNLSTNWTGATDTALASCISKLVAKGYGKIICRSVLPTGTRSSLYPTESGKIQTAVTNAANPNVVFCDISGLPVHSTVDGTHPDAAGYGVIVAYTIPLYRTILGL